MTLILLQVVNSPDPPRMPSWRRMTSEDVPSPFALINKWSSQFEIGQVFDGEEFAYNLLCSILPNYVYTYMVEMNLTISIILTISLIL